MPDENIQLPKRPPVADCVKLYEHQNAGFERAMAHFTTGQGLRGYGFLFEMGLGKSLTAIATMGQLFVEGRIDRVLVCAPTSVCAVWPAELQKFAAFPFVCQPLLGDSAKRKKTLEALRPRFTRTLLVAVINYESTWRIEDELMAWKPDMIICDESQRIKNPRAAQSKALHRLGDKTHYKLILSGTPVSNSPLDLWSQYRFLDMMLLGPSYFQFERNHAIFGGRPINGKPRKLVGYVGLDKLMEKAYSIASRATKADALDLPEKTFEQRPVILGDAETKAYRQMQEESLVWLGEHETTATNVLTRMLRLQQITGGFLIPDGETVARQLGTAKLDALRDIVEDYVLGEGRKLVVFFRFKAEGQAIRRMLAETIPHDEENPRPPYYGFIDGSIPQASREAEVKRFQTDPASRVFVTNIDTGGLGITLTAASCEVFYSLNFNYAAYAQALDRIHRIGQHHPCHYIHLVAPGTIDEHVMEALEAKQDMAVSLVDDSWRRIFGGR